MGIKPQNNSMKSLYSLFLLLSAVFAFSQTKLIAFKSHSGPAEHFSTAVSENRNDVNFSNLGIRREDFSPGQLDSVIVIDDNKTVVVGSTSFNRSAGTKKERFKMRDTLYDNKLFPSRNFNSMKDVLKSRFSMSKTDSIVILEYNKENKSYREIKPQTGKSEKDRSEKIPKGLLLGVLMFSGASGFYRWKRNKKNNEG